MEQFRFVEYRELSLLRLPYIQYDVNVVFLAGVQQPGLMLYSLRSEQSTAEGSDWLNVVRLHMKACAPKRMHACMHY